MENRRDVRVRSRIAELKRELARQDELLRHAIRTSGVALPALEACLQFAPRERNTGPAWLGARRV